MYCLIYICVNIVFYFRYIECLYFFECMYSWEEGRGNMNDVYGCSRCLISLK